MPLWSRRTYSPALASAAGRLQKAARLKSKNPFPSQHQRIRAQPVTCGITKAPVKTASKKKKKKKSVSQVNSFCLIPNLSFPFNRC